MNKIILDHILKNVSILYHVFINAVYFIFNIT